MGKPTRDRDGDAQQAEHPGDELLVGLAAPLERVPIDDLAEDDRVDQAQQLGRSGQGQREQDEPALRLQVGPENLLARTLGRLLIGRGIVGRTMLGTR